MRTCQSIYGNSKCEFIRQHGGKYHGVFRGVSRTTEQGAFLRLWPRQEKKMKPIESEVDVNENLNVEEDWGHSSWNESGRTETDKGERNGYHCEK